MDSRKILRVETGILSFEIQNTAQGIQNATYDYNIRIKIPLTKTGIQ